MTRSYPMTKAVEDQHRKKKGALEFDFGLFFYRVFVGMCIRFDVKVITEEEENSLLQPGN